MVRLVLLLVREMRRKKRGKRERALPQLFFSSILTAAELQNQKKEPKKSISHQVDDAEGREGDVPAPVDLLAALEDLE